MANGRFAIYNKSTANVVVLLDNFIPAVRGTTRTDERPTAHATTLESAAHFYNLSATTSGPPETGRWRLQPSENATCGGGLWQGRQR